MKYKKMKYDSFSKSIKEILFVMVHLECLI